MKAGVNRQRIMVNKQPIVMPITAIGWISGQAGRSLTLPFVILSLSKDD
jgi:hypothetical protein